MNTEKLIAEIEAKLDTALTDDTGDTLYYAVEETLKLIRTHAAGEGWQPIGNKVKETVWRNDRHGYGEWVIGCDNYSNRRECRWWQCGDASNFLDRGGRAFYPVAYMPLPAAPASNGGGE